MSKLIKENGAGGSEFLLEINGANRGEGVYTLIRNGTKWQKPYQNSKAIRVISDGNGVEATVYRDAKGRTADTIKLDYAEAFELAMTLLEFTKDDPNAPTPLYEAYEKEATRALPKKARRNRR